MTFQIHHGGLLKAMETLATLILIILKYMTASLKTKFLFQSIQQSFQQKKNKKDVCLTLQKLQIC